MKNATYSAVLDEELYPNITLSELLIECGVPRNAWDDITFDNIVLTVEDCVTGAWGFETCSPTMRVTVTVDQCGKKTG